MTSTGLSAARYSTLLLFVAVLFAFGIGRAAAALPAYDVFVGIERGETRVYFVDDVTGLSRVVPAQGTRHTLLANGVIYLEESESGAGAVRIVYPDGRNDVYSLMPPIGPDLIVDWVVSADSTRIAWAQTERKNNTLSSDLYISDIDGLDKRLALHTSSTQGVGALPLAVTDDGAVLFYTRLSDPFGDRPAPLTVESVLRLDTATGQSTPLPDADNCPCAVALTPDGASFARLNSDFSLRILTPATSGDVTLQAPRVRARQGGYMLLSPDGARAMYVLTDGVGRFSLVLAEIAQNTQRVLTSNLRDYVRVTHIAGDYAILVGVSRPSTYKIDLADGSLTQISAYTWLGQLN